MNFSSRHSLSAFSHLTEKTQKNIPAPLEKISIKISVLAGKFAFQI